MTAPAEAGSAAAGRLDRERYLSLETFRRSGAGVRTPVWFAAQDGRLYVFTAGDSGKVKRLRHSTRARVAPCDLRGRVHGPWREARARIVTAADVRERGYRALRAKYGLQMRCVDWLSRLSGRIAHRLLLELEL